MCKPLQIILNEAQQSELEQARDHDPRPYLREHAAAILKIAAGASGRDIALHGLLKRRGPKSVYRWFRRYQADGLAGLIIRSGRGRKPAFFPSLPHG